MRPAKDYKGLKDESAVGTRIRAGGGRRPGGFDISDVPDTGHLAARPSREAVRLGVADAFRLPVWVVAASMLGFGSLARDSGISLAVATVSTATIWGLPGQVAFVELFAVGAPVLAVVVASSMANLRFLPMSISMVPLFRRHPASWRWRYVLVALMSVNTWALLLRRAPELDDAHRGPYFAGLGVPCITAGVLATALGYHLAGILPFYVTAGLIFLNIMYFTYLFAGVRQRNCLMALGLGAVLGPVFHLMSPDWGLPVCGTVAGTAAYFLDLRIGGGDG